MTKSKPRVGIDALLIVTAGVEAATGLALIVAPALPVSLLLGAPLDAPGALVVARVAGAALVTIGIACGLARADGRSHAARGLVAAALFYNVAVAALLVHATVIAGLSGLALWPAVGLHAALASWCVACLRRRNQNREDGASLK